MAGVGRKNGVSGRRPGSRNRRTVLQVRERLEELGVDLVKEIVANIQLVDDPNERTRLYLELLKYAAPQMKAVEVGQVSDETVAALTALTTEQLLLMAEGTDDEEQ